MAALFRCCLFAALFILSTWTSTLSAEDSDFSFGNVKQRTSTATPTTTGPTSIINIVPLRNASDSGRNRTSRLLSPKPNDRNETMNVKSRALFEPSPFPTGGSTSIETNFLSIQSQGSKFTTSNDASGNLIGLFPQGFQPGPSIPIGSSGISGPISGRPINNNNLSPALTGTCSCEMFADCRDVSAFARSDRNRQDFCPTGKVLCCSGRKPLISAGPANIIGVPQPQPILVPAPLPYNPNANPASASVPNVPVNSNGALGGLLTQGCGLKGGNPLARTFDVTNPRGDAEFGEYPWMSAILRSDLNYVCGGALIEAGVVLTAAHCVAKVKGEDLVVRLGEFDVSETTEPPYQDVHVKKVIIHGDYHSGTLRNDIALLILDQPVRTNSYIRPVCLPPAVDFTGMTCTVTGWGKNSPNGQFSNVLKEVNLPVIEKNQCQSMLRNAPELGPVFNLHDSFLCAGQAGKDACAGDGGSPLICKVDGAWRLAGLVSWGIGCGQFPGAYVNVAKFLPWIEGVVRENFQL